MEVDALRIGNKIYIFTGEDSKRLRCHRAGYMGRCFQKWFSVGKSEVILGGFPGLHPSGSLNLAWGSQCGEQGSEVRAMPCHYLSVLGKPVHSALRCGVQTWLSQTFVTCW